MKLEGIKVVDLSLFLPGPYLTMVMADHGAEVIKIEPPAGEPTRDIGAKAGGTSVWFRNTHRGKRCVTLDLKHPDDKARLFEMLAEADVIGRGLPPRRRHPSRHRLRNGAGDQPAHRLLRDLGLRPDRPRSRPPGP
ncbi:CoA transferase [Tistrella mobilis]|uniref:CoA transferase n=1 Tax=Tistrella mobilis TaxID=171437 RepID=UPI00224D0B1C|nr:CoA transferase [Tistrella mobilis]